MGTNEIVSLNTETYLQRLKNNFYSKIYPHIFNTKFKQQIRSIKQFSYLTENSVIYKIPQIYKNASKYNTLHKLSTFIPQM